MARGMSMWGGTFTSYNGTTGLNRILRLNSDGSRDTGFAIGTGFDTSVNAVAIATDGSGDVYAGGDFTSYNGTTGLNRIIRLNSDGSRDTAFAIGTGFNTVVYSIAPSLRSTHLYVGGYFTTYKSVVVDTFARLSATGTQGAEVTNVTVTNANGTYIPGQSLTIQVSFSMNVTVTGTPQLTLETGATDAIVNYASGSGTKTLTFTYVIGASHVSGDVDYKSTSALAPNGGSIKDSAGGDASLTLATPGQPGSIGANKSIVVEGTTPSVAAISPDAGGIDGGAPVTITGGNFKSGVTVALGGNSCAGVNLVSSTKITCITTAAGVPGTVNVTVTNPGNLVGTLTNGYTYGVDEDGPFNRASGFDGKVDSIAAANDGSNDVYVGGSFLSYRTGAASRIVRLNKDGTRDVGFATGTGFAGNVTALAVATDGSGDVYVGGYFTSYNGTSGVNGIVRLNSDGSIDTAFATGTGFDGAAVWAIAVATDASGDLYVGGQFTTYNGTSGVNRIVRLNSDGTRDTGFATGTGFNGNVGTIAVATDGSGDVYTGGDFTTYNGATGVLFIQRLNSNGTRDTGFAIGTSFDGVVIALAPATDGSGDVYVGGQYTSYNGTSGVNNIVRLDSTGTRDTGFAVGTAFNTSVYAITIATDASNDVYAGGAFTLFNGTSGVNYAARLNSNGSRDTGFALGTAFDGAVRAFAPTADASGDIYLGGDFVSFNGSGANHLVRLDSNGAIDSGTALGAGFQTTVNAIASDSSGLVYVGGAFTTWNGNTTQNRIIRLKPDGSNDTAFNSGSGFDLPVETVAPAVDGSGNVYVGGQFTSYKGTGSLNRILRLDSTGSRDTSFAIGTGFDNTVFVVAPLDDGSGDVYVGGNFTSYSGTSGLNRIVRLNADGTLDTGFSTGTGFNSAVYEVAFAADGSGDIYLAGNFAAYNGASVGYIVRLNSDGSRDTAFNTGTGFSSSTLAIAAATDGSGDVYVGGSFTSFNGTSGLTRILRLNSDGTHDTAFTIGTGVDNNVHALLAARDGSGDVYVGGVFTTYNGTSGLNGSMRLNPNGSLDAGFATGSGFASLGQVYSLAPSPRSAHVYAGGAFTTYRSAVVDRIARLSSTGTHRPMVTNVTIANADGSYTTGQTLTIQVAFSMNVTVTGTPQLTLETGTIDSTVNYTSGSGSKVLVFSYTIGTWGDSVDLDYQSLYALANASGSTIRDSTGIDVDLALPVPGQAGSIGANKAIVLEATPAIASISQSAGSVDGGVGVTITGTAFKSGATVYLGSNQCTGATVSPDKITCTTGAASGAGTVNVTVTNPSTLSATLTNGYTYGVAEDGPFSKANGLSDTVYAVAAANDGSEDVYVGGEFTAYRGTVASRIIRLNKDGTRDPAFDLGTGFDAPVRAIAVATDGSGDIYVGGDFTSYNGTSGLNRIVRLNANGTHDTAFATGTGFSSFVFALAVANDGSNDLYVGGSFTTYNGTAGINNLTRLDSNGTRDTGFAVGTAVNAQVYALAVATDASGDVYLGGNFTSFNGTAGLNRILRINSNGTRDTTFAIGTGLNVNVRSLAIATDASNDVYVGGDFTSYNGTTGLNYILRLDSNGTRDTGFAVGTAFDAAVMALAVPSDASGDVYAGGGFTSFNGTSAQNRLLRLNSNGTRDTAFTGLFSRVGPWVFAAALTVDSSNDIYAGGSFTEFNGSGADRLVRLNADGTTDAGSVLGSGSHGLINALAPATDSSGDVYVGGGLSDYNGNNSANYLARLNADGSFDTAFNFGTGFDAVVNELAVATDGSGDVYVGGNFTSFNATAINRIARLNSNGSLDSAFGVGTALNGAVYALAAATDGSGDVYVGGAFTAFGGVTVNGIVRINPDGTRDAAFNVGTGLTGTTTVTALTMATNGSGDVYVGGSFTTYNGTAGINRIVRLNSDGTRDTVFANGTGFDATVRAIAIATDGTGDVYVGGGFTTYKGAAAAYITRLDSNGTLDTGFAIGTGFNTTVLALNPATDGSNDVYVGGDFTSYNGTSGVNNITRLNSNGTRDTAFAVGTGFNSTVRAITPSLRSTQVYVGGLFTTFGSTTVGYLSRLNSNGTLDAQVTNVTVTNANGTYSPGQTLTIEVSFSMNATVSGTPQLTLETGATDGIASYVSGSGTKTLTFSWVIAGPAETADLDYQGTSALSANGGTLKDSGGGDAGLTLPTPGAAGSIGANKSIVVEAPTITAISQNAGSVGGGVPVTITGTTFKSGATVYLGSNQCTSVNVVSGTTITCLTGMASGAGTVNVVVTNPSTASATLTNGYTYGVDEDGPYHKGRAFDDEVLTVAPAADGSGDVYVGGMFDAYGAIPVNEILRLNSNGTLDPAFVQGSGFSGSVYSIVAAGDGSGDVYVGGSYVTYNGASSAFIVRLNADGSRDTGFNVGGGFDNSVFAMALAADGSGDIYVGGNFTSYNGTSGLNRIIRLNSDGTRDTGFATGTGFDNMVRTIATATDGSGDIYAGGYFTSYNGATGQNRIIRLNSNGTRDTAFAAGTGFAATVYSLAAATDGSGDVYVGGDFTSYNGTTGLNYILRLNNNGTRDTGFAVGTGLGNWARALVVATDGSNDLYVGGYFTSFNGTTGLNRILRLNSDGTRDTAFAIGTGANGRIAALAIATDGTGDVYAGGIPTNYNGTGVDRLVRLNSDGTVDAGTVPGSGLSAIVTALATPADNSGDLYVGGYFTDYGDSTGVNYIVRLNPDGGRDTGFNVGTGFDMGVRDIAFALDGSGDLYVAGDFTSFNGTTGLNKMLRLNTDGSHDTGFNPGTGFNGTILGIVPATDGSGEIYAVGAFTTFNGTSINRILRLNSDGTRDTAFNVGTGLNDTPLGIAPASDGTGDVYFVGDFTTYNGATTNRIVRVNSDGTRDTGFAVGTGLDATTYAVEVATDGSGDVYVGGSFTTYNGTTGLNRILRLNSNGTRDTGFDIGTGCDSAVEDFSIAPDGSGDVYVAGTFTAYNGSGPGRIVRLNSDGTHDTGFSTGAGPSFSVEEIVPSLRSAHVYAGGIFGSYNGVTVDYLARLSTTGAMLASVTNVTLTNANGSYNPGQSLTIQVSFSMNVTVSGTPQLTLETGNPDAVVNYASGSGTRVLTFTYVIGSGHETAELDYQSTSALSANGGSIRDSAGNDATLTLAIPGAAGSLGANKNIVVGTPPTVTGISLSAGAQSGGVPVTVSGTDFKSGATVYLGSNQCTGASVISSTKLTCITGTASGPGTVNVTVTNPSTLAGTLTNGYTYAVAEDGYFNPVRGASGSVNAVAQANDGSGDVYIGGNFTVFATGATNGTAGYIVRLNSDGTLDTGFNVGTGFGALVNSIVPATDGSGDVYVGGNFTSFNGTSAINRIVRLNSDGTLDTAFAVGTAFDSNVHALGIAKDGSNDVYVGGDFTSFNGTSGINRITRLNSNGTRDTGFAVGTGFSGGSVLDFLLPSDGDIYVGGAFTSFNGTTGINRIVRINSDGTRDTGFAVGTAFAATVHSMALSSTGDVYPKRVILFGPSGRKIIRVCG